MLNPQRDRKKADRFFGQIRAKVWDLMTSQIGQYLICEGNWKMYNVHLLPQYLFGKEAYLVPYKVSWH